MSETDPKKIIELYDLMERRLEDIGITFDEFSVLYKTFKKRTSTIEVEEEEAKPSPFPWVKYAGYGKYS